MAPWCAPFYVFDRILGIPWVTGGVGHSGGAHAPDEGSMELGGRRYAPRGPYVARRAGVACVAEARAPITAPSIWLKALIVAPSAISTPGPKTTCGSTVTSRPSLVS